MTLEERNAMLGEEPEEGGDEDDDDEDDEEEEEEDLIDPMDDVKETCRDSQKCRNYRDELDSCTDRVNSKTKTEEHCTQELFDFLHCTDKCIADNLFKHLK